MDKKYSVKKTLLNVFREHRCCDCGGEFIFVNSLTSTGTYPTTYYHQCNKCGNEILFEDKYPKVCYEDAVTDDLIINSAQLTPTESTEAVMLNTADLSCVLSEEEFLRKEKSFFKSYGMHEATPMYKCPKCDKGIMYRDETVVLTSNPPQYRYFCNQCGHVTSHHT